MATSKSKVTDSITVELNGTTVEPEGKGPDPDRLANHKAETKAYEARLRKEAK